MRAFSRFRSDQEFADWYAVLMDLTLDSFDLPDASLSFRRAVTFVISMKARLKFAASKFLFSHLSQ